MKPRQKARLITGVTLVAALVAIAFLNAVYGQYHIPLTDVFAYLTPGKTTADPTAAQVLTNIRIPRIIQGLLVGAALAVAGAILQAIFSNPLAEPGIIGVSAGAAVGASTAIVLNLTFLGSFTVPALAFITGAATTAIIYAIARGQGKAQVIALILTGIAVNALAGAIIAIFTYLAPTTARDQIVFWQMGSLNASNWASVYTVAPLLLVGTAAAIYLAPQLDMLALGEAAASHVGINVPALRRWAVILTALLTAAAVAFAGIITFVGLIVPHLLRLLIGPANRYLIPACALGGAVLVSGSDLLARNLIAFADLPIGIFTALVGGPLFLLLLRGSITARGSAQ